MMFNLGFILILSIVNLAIASLNSPIKLDLQHRLHDEAFLAKTPKIERVRALLRSDDVRRTRRRASEIGYASPGAIQMISAVDFGAAQYVVTLKVGTPPQRLSMLVDTGSDLTWVKCRRRRKFPAPGGTLRREGEFFADASSSFSTVPCDSEMCSVKLRDVFSLSRCEIAPSPCIFDFRYSDGSSSRGIFAHESITLGRKSGHPRVLFDVLLGCSSFFEGESFDATNGILGLGFSEFSFANRATTQFGGAFSYCLVDHLSPKNISGFLTFGRTPVYGMQFADIFYGPGVGGPWYAVKVSHINISNAMLEIPTRTWDAGLGGGAILDSGSSLSFLTEPAYGPVMAALRLYLDRFERVDPGISQLEYCFDSTGYLESEVPRLTIELTGGAQFVPPVKSYIIEVDGNVKCIGFVSAPWPGVSVIGNILQQNFVWEFDLSGNKVGFAPFNCT